MPALTKSTEAGRILQAMQALQLMMRGTPKEEACAEFGLSTWQFDQWIATESEAIEQLQTYIAESERVRLAQINHAQGALLNKLISEISDPKFDDQRTVLAALKYLDSLRDALERRHGVQSQTDDASEYLLSGPATRVEDSKMDVEHELSKTSGTLNVKTRADGSVDISIPHKPDIIDVLEGTEEEDLSGE